MRNRCFRVITTGLLLLISVALFFKTADTPVKGYDVINEAATIIFQMLDEGTLLTDLSFNLYGVDGMEANGRVVESIELIRSFELLKNADIAQVYIVDPNVILFSYGGHFQSVSGVVKTRNHPDLKADWGSTGFDGSMIYRKIDDSTFCFSDGL